MVAKKAETRSWERIYGHCQHGVNAHRKLSRTLQLVGLFARDIRDKITWEWCSGLRSGYDEKQKND